MIELIVFDMAGTTVDEKNVVYATVRDAVNAAGYTFSQEDVNRVGAGKEKSQAIRDVLALDGRVHSDAEVQSIFADFRQRLADAYASLEVEEQPGARDTFQWLRQHHIRVALNTGYDSTTAADLIAKLGWQIERDFDALVTASDVARGRPAPDMIYRAMELTGATNSATVAKVGDSQIDIEEGKNAECGLTVGVTTGAHTKTQLRQARPSAIIDRLAELIDLITTS